MKYSKRTLVLFFLTLCAVSGAYAQESPLADNSKALQFQISDDFNLDSFTGTLFSYKWHVSEKRARRLGLSFNTDYTARERNADNDQTINNSRWDFNISINYTWVNYINPEADIKFYYGYGPGINFGYGKTKSEEENGIEPITTMTRYGIAALGYAGVEWFFQKSMSIHAEYGASLSFDFRKQENDQTETEDKMARLGGNGVKLGISVYF